MVILPSASDLENLTKILDLIKDPDKVKAAISDLKKNKKAHDDALEAAGAKLAAADDKEKQISAVVAAFDEREAAVAARENKAAEREEKVRQGEEALAGRVTEFDHACKKELPERLAAVKKREDAVAKQERANAKKGEELDKALAAAKALQEEYEKKIAQIKALAG